MFLGNFNSLDGVHTYFVLNSLRLSVFAEITAYFNTYNQYEYGYVLEYLGKGIYSLSCGHNILHFDSEHILEMEEVIEFLSSSDLC